MGHNLHYFLQLAVIEGFLYTNILLGRALPIWDFIECVCLCGDFSVFEDWISAFSC